MTVPVDTLISEHIKLQAMLEKEKAPWLALWQDITGYVLPRRSFWDLGSQEGQKPDEDRYDDTAIEALQTFTDGFQGNMISAAFNWLRMVTENPELRMLPGVADYLELVGDLHLSYYQRSNLYEAVNEFIADYGSIGTAVMLVDDNLTLGKINYSTRHMRECSIAENAAGEVDTLYRKFPMTNRQIVEAWPDTVTERQREDAKNAPFVKHPIIHAAFPSADRTYPTLREPDMPYTCEYIDPTYHTHLGEGGYESFPYLVARFRKNTGEVYGRSPAADAISSILRVNQMAAALLQSAQIAADPPMNVPADLKGSEELVPNGRNYYVKPGEVVSAIDMGRNYPITREQEEDIRRQIREMFRSRIFMLLEALEGQKAQTATWVNKVASEQAILLGPIVGRFHNEFQIPLVRRNHEIMTRMGLIPPPPPVLLAGKAANIRIELMGPLAQAQKKYHQSQGVAAGLEFLTALAQLFPEALDNADSDELARIGMDAMGMPQRVIREVLEVEQVRKMRSEAMAKQQEAEAAAMSEQELAGNADKLNKPMAPGSMLAQMLQKKARSQQQGRAVPAGTAA